MPDPPARRTREVQAESVAYAVCQHYGLDTSDYSFGYIAGWSSGKELAELKGSLETIRSTAVSLIDTIDGHFAEIQKAQDKEQTTEQAQPAQETTKQPEAETAAPELSEETTPVQEKEAQTEPEADTGVSSETPQTTQPEQVAPVAPYYTINEAAAKRAKDMNSFSDYKQGSATAEYRHYVDEAVQLAERQKQRVDPMYHEKIDSLLDTYARKLAANMNKGYEIDARVPSILIAGGSNFPTRKKEKQNAARDSNYREWQDIQGLLDKIRSTGMGGISADDPQAVQKLEKKLESLEKSQETMKAVNAYYRKHKTLDGCPHLPPEELEKLKADMASSWHLEDKPFATWALSNNSAEIRRVKDRIKSLSQQKEIGFVGWEFDGGKVDAVMQRIVELIYAVPEMLVVLLIATALKPILTDYVNSSGTSPLKSFVNVLGPNLISMFIAFGLLYWVTMSRIIRGQVLQLKQQEYVTAARALGASGGRIIRRHLLPNCIGQIVVTTCLQIPSAIFLESFLSYLGVGVSAPLPSLGSMATDALSGMYTYTYRLIVPSVILSIMILAFNLFGDGLRDALDPKLKK